MTRVSFTITKPNTSSRSGLMAVAAYIRARTKQDRFANVTEPSGADTS
jgi:hypothetical protein